MTLQIRDTIASYMPSWLQARVPEGLVNAFKYFYACAMLCDLGIEYCYQGLQAQYPTVATPTALPYIGRDRVLPRGILESDESYALRLQRWRTYWRGAGKAYSLMRQIQAFLTPSKPRIRIVNESGTWRTLNPDGTTEVVETYGAVNWDWDSQDLPSRFWIIIYSDAGPWNPDGTWGDGKKWNDGRTWGTTAVFEQIDALRAIVREFKSAGDLCQNIIVAFDPTSFNPLAAPGSPGMPDGTWGHWSKVSGGVHVPARLATARYFDGV